MSGGVETVRFTLNGVEREAPKGMLLIDAARLHGVDIPRYCSHPGLKPEGNCRMCVVEIEKMPKLQTSCTTPVQEGMVVHTESERVLEERRRVMEFLLVNHPIDCPICDQAGECMLQEYYMRHDLQPSRVELEEKIHKPKRVDLGPLVVLDAERCVLCSRCVRFCRDVAGVEELAIKNRGGHAEITAFPGRRLENPYSGNVIDICPVGALTSRDFRFKVRVWFLKTAESVCPGCERGCSIHIEQYQNEVQRIRPRENLRVNRYWICDFGRLDYRWINENRLLSAEGPSGRLRPEEADREAARLLREAKAPLLVASPRMSNESLFALRLFREKALPEARIAGGSFREPWEGDAILKRPDRNPNRRGMETLGLAGGPEEALRAGPDLVLVIENDLLGDRPEAKELLTGKKVIVLASNRDATASAAGLRVPVATYAETEGSWTNFEGITQTFHPVLRPVGDSRSVAEALAGIAAALGADLGPVDAGTLRAAVLREAPQLDPARGREEDGRVG
ncbi:MAG: (2Fe-2S)-binding protein [Candidatus Eisenbacteria bacterium]|nr:(2Fe-2S)-binding protein [Candidatus Eisenbacteria bacterium]